MFNTFVILDAIVDVAADAPEIRRVCVNVNNIMTVRPTLPGPKGEARTTLNLDVLNYFVTVEGTVDDVQEIIDRAQRHSRRVFANMTRGAS